MVGSLISGARDVRAPLAVGITLAAAMWFGFGDHLPVVADATGLLALVYRTVDALGQPASLAAGTFICYMVGSLVTNTAPSVVLSLDGYVQRFSQFIYGKFANADRTLEFIRLMANGMSPFVNTQWASKRAPAAFPIEYQLRPTVERRIEDFRSEVVRILAFEGHERVREIVSNPNMPGHTIAAMRDELVDLTMWDISQEARGLVVRLQVRSKDLYDEWDRLTAEGELRTSLALPFALLAASLAFNWSIWFAFLAILSPLLYIHGIKYLKQATSILEAGLVEGVMESPALERLETRAAMLTARQHKAGAAKDAFLPPDDDGTPLA